MSMGTKRIRILVGLFAAGAIVMLLGYVSCGGSGGGDDGGDGGDGRPRVTACEAPCAWESCTEDQWREMLVCALAEISEEGEQLDSQDVATDPEAYAKLFDRLETILGGDGDDLLLEVQGPGPEAGPLRGPAATSSFARYDPTVEYCGPDKSAPGGSYLLPDPGQCLNRACWEHDNCYDTILEAEGGECLWSQSTFRCDDAFFGAYQDCEAAGECGLRCAIASGIVAGYRVLCEAPIVEYPLWIFEDCRFRVQDCKTCTGKTETESCAAFGATCGRTYDGCGDAIDCGTCGDFEACGNDGELDNQCVAEVPLYHVFKRTGTGYRRRWGGLAEKLTGYDYTVHYVYPSEAAAIEAQSSNFAKFTDDACDAPNPPTCPCAPPPDIWENGDFELVGAFDSEGQLETFRCDNSPITPPEYLCNGWESETSNEFWDEIGGLCGW